ncbi:MAG: threonylcarbamoyl-AMP synthase [Candidatus Zambryskibacteria bacterium RIFCSPLOWO2_02_FULL_44_12b]|uniref:L-threonylcarbamoyladenylate synthase n=1 Tax=Candidatus Zambryskibacteria bacterium RIFCSPLOWO2_02_FULL_44_12b TaxID=1802772 RepID=A0A1G2UM15_9BACT|nr:MAG: threonylcarbamoyl-AMP synthase [Candidatus Zambryskibacteria bacterium RIFCSPLOWO2_02_FULL_44_12b]
MKSIGNDSVGILPTDTLYSLAGPALSKKAVKKIYYLKRRDFTKPLIVMIASTSDLDKFHIKLNRAQRRTLSHLWPGKISVILPCQSKKFSYLTRNTGSLAFRIPKKKSLTKILKLSGPLVVPSANPEGKKPAETIAEAKKYFGNKLNFYIDAGRLCSKPSTLVSLQPDGSVTVLRKGASKLPRKIN